MNDYPEHDRLSAVADESQAIGAFLDWLTSEAGYRIIRWVDDPDYNEPVPVGWDGITKTLARYFNIDLVKIEREKEQMLERLRAAQV